MDTASLKGVIVRTGTRPVNMRFITNYTYLGRNSQLINQLLEDYKRGGFGKRCIIDIGIGASYFRPGIAAITTRELAKIFLPFPDVAIVGIDRDLRYLEKDILSKKPIPENFPPFTLPNLIYIEADATRTLGVEPCSADTVLCFNVIEHLSTKEIEGLFQQVFLALKIDGKFYYSLKPTKGVPASPCCLIKEEDDSLQRWIETPLGFHA